MLNPQISRQIPHDPLIKRTRSSSLLDRLDPEVYLYRPSSAEECRSGALRYACDPWAVSIRIHDPPDEKHQMHAGFGLGRLHHILSRRNRERVVLSAIDAGFRHFDLAPAYGDGLTEKELGRILGGRRDKIHIATKYGIPFRPIGEYPTPTYFFVRATGILLRRSFGAQYGRRDFSARALVQSLDASLRRLRTDHVDFLLVHEPLSLDQFRTLDDSWAELERQQRLGRIRRFGVSSDTQLLLDAERERLVPETATRMVPMNDVTCGLDQSWFCGREVFVFSIVKYLLRHRAPGRIETDALLNEFAGALPGCRPILASNNLEEIRRMGQALAKLCDCDRHGRAVS